METEKHPPCPTCLGKLTYEGEGPHDDRLANEGIVGALASAIYRCPEHGLWQIYISGRAVPYVGTPQR